MNYEACECGAVDKESCDAYPGMYQECLKDRIPIGHTDFRKGSPLIVGVAKPTIGPDEVITEVRTKVKSDGWSTDYYVIPEGAEELGDLIEYKDMNFNVGNIFKAAYRLGQKEDYDELYDINKILWYAEREKKRLERINNE